MEAEIQDDNLSFNYIALKYCFKAELSDHLHYTHFSANLK